MTQPADAAAIDPAWLSPKLAELAEIMGLPAALKLCKARGGTRLYIPLRPTPEHWLAKIIGMDALKALCEQRAGDLLEVPKAEAVTTALRVQAVRAARAGGKSERDVALAFGLTARQVRRICAGMERPQPQRDLFAVG